MSDRPTAAESAGKSSSNAAGETLNGALRDEAAFARQVLAAEASAIAGIALDAAFHHAVDCVVQHCGGERSGLVVLTGLGKSGQIAQKISATFASTGMPSHFLHPVEAMHGDLGRIRKEDVVVALSFGGNTEEVVALATVLRHDGVPVIAITGRPDSDLAKQSVATLNVGLIEEACPLNLAPTASTAAMLAMGDALALTCSRRLGFGVDDFRKRHPGGSLGRQLQPVVQALRFRVGENLPVFPVTSTLGEAYETLAQESKRGVRLPGAILAVDDAGKLRGIFTDADLRRLLLDSPDAAAVLARKVNDVMHADPKHLRDDALVRDAVQLVRDMRIDEVPVVDEAGCPIGLLDVQDLIAWKVIES